MPRGAANVQLTHAQGCSAKGQPVGGAESSRRVAVPTSMGSPMPRGALRCTPPEASLMGAFECTDAIGRPFCLRKH
eukprot:15440255-Alexandrium_andersonii.AAC.1